MEFGGGKKKVVGSGKKVGGRVGKKEGGKNKGEMTRNHR